jgi:hypothetical protein
MSNPILAPYNTIYIPRGSSRTLPMPITDANGKPLDLTGATVIFTVKQTVLDTSYMIHKSSVNPLQIAITSARGGLVSIFLLYSDTIGKDPGEYVYDVWVIDSLGNRFPVIDPAPFVIQPTVTTLI